MSDDPTEAVAEDFRCGLVALIGRPNVGKSTLLNALIGVRLSIVSPRPQTTRHRIIGVSTRPTGQIVYVDTPGMHRGAKHAMNRSLNRAARSAVAEVDLALHLVEPGHWGDEDQTVYNVLAEHAVTRLLIVNKTDVSRDKSSLLPFVAAVTEAHVFDAVYYVSALKHRGLAQLERGIIARLPQRSAMYDADTITDRSERFLAAELVREQLMLRLEQELPYATAVVVDRFVDRADGVTEVHAVIWVERDGQKAIVIGHGGEQLKAIGMHARRRMEQMFGRRVFLQLWVKVRQGWADDDNAIRRFGYTD